MLRQRRLSSRRLMAGWVVALALGSSAGAQAASADERFHGAVALPAPAVRLAGAERRAALEAAPAWSAFRARHGRWSAEWNEITGSPHRAVGPPIALAGNPSDAAAVDRAVRDFVGANPEVFGAATTLETAAVQAAGGRWFARYRQTFHGVPVAFSDWEFRVSQGRLTAFGADAHRIPESTPVRPQLVAAAARAAAGAGLVLDPTTDRVEGGEALWLVPIASSGGVTYRLALEARVSVQGPPPAHWIVLVDAMNGEVLWRHDQVREAITGTVTGQVHPALPSDPLATRAFAHEGVSVGTTDVVTDLNGAYGVASPSGNNIKITSKLAGTFCVADRPGTDASFTSTVQNPAVVDIAWSGGNSLDSERDGYYHVNLIHDFVKSIDPGFTGNDYAMPCHVEVAGSCNSFWDGVGVNFYAAGAGCPSIATLPDMVYHEVGHGVNDNLYRQAGVSFGMINGALHEGLADVNAASFTDNPVIGNDFYGPGTSLRTLSNTLRWPQDRSGDPHNTGLILGGAFWDLRQSLGLALAARLFHFAKYGTPDDVDDGIAMSEYFLEVLNADDDDANLANGTPHLAAIEAAFDAHGIGTSRYFGITHTALGDQALPGPYPIVAIFAYAGPFGALDPASPTLHYAIDGGPFTPTPMHPTGNPNQYSAAIPAVGGAIVRYYLSASDLIGGTATLPAGAPGFDSFVFLAGATTTALAYDLETDQGWTVGAPGDAAVTGVWLRADPVGNTESGVPVQPEFDHTADPGVACYVTGNAAPSDPVGTADVDGGKTTLLTPVFSALGLSHPAIEYYRWYTNNAGADPATDSWRVDLSNDGGSSWTPIEDTRQSDPSWRRVVFAVADVLPPTASMRLRFVAEDVGRASVVEAAVDDFRLLGLPATTGVAPGAAASGVAFAAPTPNPSAGAVTLRYVLAAAAPVSLAIFDAGGRRIRQLERGPSPAGEHALRWDGRDEAGRPVRSGAYFARLVVDGRGMTRTLVRVR